MQNHITTLRILLNSTPTYSNMVLTWHDCKTERRHAQRKIIHTAIIIRFKLVTQFAVGMNETGFNVEVTESHYTDTGLTRSHTVPMMPGAWRESYLMAPFIKSQAWLQLKLCCVQYPNALRDGRPKWSTVTLETVRHSNNKINKTNRL